MKVAITLPHWAESEMGESNDGIKNPDLVRLIA
jgi:hypothetical protein